MHNKKYIIKHSKNVYKNKYLSLWEDSVLLHSGKEILRNKLDVGDGSVVVVVIDKSGNFFMVRQYRHAIEKYSTEFVSGGIKSGETALRAAKRELAEELGLKAKKMKKILEFNPNNSLMNRMAYVFLATDIEDTLQKQDDYEDIVKVIETKKSILEKIKSGKIKDAFTISAFFAFLINKKLI